jgi:hypothetical protein
MIGRPAHSLHASIRQGREVTRIAAFCLTLSGCWISGCIEIDGGAAELSWSLRSQEGESVDSCHSALIDDVRLCWEPVEDGSVLGSGGPCRSLHRSFPCEESSGITAFNLDPGETAFWIEPICDDRRPADAGTYQVPPPIVRNVEDGQIVSLNSLLLVVSPTGDVCPSTGCTCVRR